MISFTWFTIEVTGNKFRRSDENSNGEVEVRLATDQLSSTASNHTAKIQLQPLLLPVMSINHGV